MLVFYSNFGSTKKYSKTVMKFTGGTNPSSFMEWRVSPNHGEIVFVTKT